MIQIRHLNLGEQMGYRDVNKSSLIVLGCNAGLDRLTDLENKKNMNNSFILSHNFNTILFFARHLMGIKKQLTD